MLIQAPELANNYGIFREDLFQFDQGSFSSEDRGRIAKVCLELNLNLKNLPNHDLTPIKQFMQYREDSSEGDGGA